MKEVAVQLTWIEIGSLIMNSVLALLFILGAYFMVRRYMRKMRPTGVGQAEQGNLCDEESPGNKGSSSQLP